MQPKVSVIIVNWNGARYLRACIESIAKSDYENKEIVVVDNASTDNSIDIIRESGNGVRLIENKENEGYAGGANKGINATSGEYVLIANPDIILERDYIKKLVEKGESNEKIAALTGKLKKYDFAKNERLNVIDSAGIRLDHSRHGQDIGQNETDNGQHDKRRRVFATCGAASLYKREALEAVKINGDVFDKDFFAYKEDIDLGWRLNLYGYENWYEAEAVAYHGRGMNSAKGIADTIRNKRRTPARLNGLSLRNQYEMMMKNECRYTLKKDMAGIAARLLKYILLYLLTSPKTLKYLYEAYKNRHIFREKRLEIARHTKIDDEEKYRLFDL